MMASKYNWRITLPQREITLSFLEVPETRGGNPNEVSIKIKENGETYISTGLGQRITVDSLTAFIELLKDAHSAASSYFTEK